MKSRGPAVREDLLLPVARLEYFHLAAQDRRERDIALPRFEEQLAAPHDAARAERLQHGELPVVEFRKGDALCVAVELLVFLEFGHGGSSFPNPRRSR